MKSKGIGDIYISQRMRNDADPSLLCKGFTTGFGGRRQAGNLIPEKKLGQSISTCIVEFAEPGGQFPSVLFPGVIG